MNAYSLLWMLLAVRAVFAVFVCVCVPMNACGGPSPVAFMLMLRWAAAVWTRGDACALP